MNHQTSVKITIFTADDFSRHLAELGALLKACVDAGASIGFILPFSESEAEGFWRDKVLPPVREGSRVMLIAWVEGRIAGTVQLNHDTPANQPHRADVSKLLVHPKFRRKGIARALMVEIEHHANRLNRSLLTLDTRTGDTAEPLYTSIGYQTSGVIPGYCLDPHGPNLDSTTIMYKNLIDV